jgi:hypothetical protein
LRLGVRAFRRTLEPACPYASLRKNAACFTFGSGECRSWCLREVVNQYFDCNIELRLGFCRLGEPTRRKGEGNDRNQTHDLQTQTERPPKPLRFVSR